MENLLILITGATGGIGGATARMLHAGGFRLVLSGRNEKKLAKPGRELDAPWFAADVTKEDEVSKLYEAALSPGDTLQGVVHAVGSMMLKPAHITSAEDFRTAVDLNLTSAFFMLKHGVKPMFSTTGSPAKLSAWMADSARCGRVRP